MHYEYIKKSENIFQKIVSNLEPNGKWNINHLITLACPDGQKTDYFNCRTIVPLVYTTETTSIAIHIMTDTSAMKKDEILTKISYSGLFMSQPFQNKENQNFSGHNKERFDYKEKFSTREEEVRELHWFKRSIPGWIACRLIRWNMKVRKKMKERKKHISNPDNPLSKALRGETI